MIERESFFPENKRSVSGKNWIFRKIDESQILMISQNHDLPEIISRVLVSRGVFNEDVNDFLSPKIKNSLTDPMQLIDMRKAAKRIVDAISKGEQIAIFGDYDVDGATSSALFYRFFQYLGYKAVIYIPDRMKEGYGPNDNAFRKLKNDKVSVVITVDCGTTAFQALETAKDLGIDVIVVDHHKAETKLPLSFAIINPNRMDENSDLGHLAAVGVSYLLIIAINRILRESGWFTSKKIAEPNLLKWLDLVALGTVCDLVPLRGLNRAFVSQGLKVAHRRKNVGIAALSEVAKIDEKINCYHIGFLIGPRINAGGRIGESSLGSNILIADDKIEAQSYAAKLDFLNRERQKIEQHVFAEANDQIAKAGKDKAALALASSDWHPGVLGIVASRLKEIYNKPVCLFSIDKKTAKGSGRSVSGFDLGSTVIAARQKGLLSNGGGHAMAAGMTIDVNKIKEFEDHLISSFLKSGESEGEGEYYIDGILDINGANLSLLDQLEKLSPFGMGNPQPRFILNKVKIVKPEVVGQNHIRCILAGFSGGSLKAIAFNCVERNLGKELLQSRSLLCNIAGYLKGNFWQGKQTAQFIIEDLSTAHN